VPCAQCTCLNKKKKGPFVSQYNARNFAKGFSLTVCVGARTRESGKIINTNLERQDQIESIARATVAGAMADATTLIITSSESEFIILFVINFCQRCS
jgi:hypothetical protein